MIPIPIAGIVDVAITAKSGTTTDSSAMKAPGTLALFSPADILARRREAFLRTALARLDFEILSALDVLCS